jgi:hypothetical protein
LDWEYLEAFVELGQAMIPAPLHTRTRPKPMTEKAAIFSPKRRTFKERKELESPVNRSTGRVPSPKNTIVMNPVRGLWVVAAVTIIAQERQQGSSAARLPKATFDESPLDLRRAEIRLPIREPVQAEVFKRKEGRGITFKRRSPRNTSRSPPTRVTLPLRPKATLLRSAA